MSRAGRRAALCLPWLILGCGAAETGPACRDPGLQALVGQPVQALADRFPEGGYKVDWPLPDGTVTLEEFPDRVRAFVDEGGVILGMACG